MKLSKKEEKVIIEVEDSIVEVDDSITEEVNELPEKVVNAVSARRDVQQEVLSYDQLMNMANMLAKSTIVPIMYQNRPENTFVALDMASRMGISPMVVMQNLYVIQGKPSWSGQAMASMIRNSSQFKNVTLNYVGTEGKDDWGAYVTATRTSDGKELKGATVTIMTAKKEGWYQKGGSKWQTIPELMLAYRAYAWFGRVHAPEIMMGLQSTEEVYDSADSVEKEKPVNPYGGEGNV